MKAIKKRGITGLGGLIILKIGPDIPKSFPGFERIQGSFAFEAPAQALDFGQKL